MKRTYIDIGYTNLFDKTYKLKHKSDKLKYKFMEYGLGVSIIYSTKTLIQELQYARRIIDYK